MKRGVLWLAVGLTGVLAVAGCETAKSANPLSPTVAGPIPGVQITAPAPLQPTSGQNIEVGAQPLTLVMQNATTNGQRPLTYSIDVAADAQFSNKVVSRQGVTPGSDGRTSFKLPDALAADHSYCWRARAEDGANTGPYSSTVCFNVFTPIVLGAPVPVSPIGDVRVAERNPTLVIHNAARSGPVGAMVYEFQIGLDQAFSQLVNAPLQPEAPGDTSRVVGMDLPYNTHYYWRARAWEQAERTPGPWSAVSTFWTPLEPPPPPTPTPTPTPIPDPGTLPDCDPHADCTALVAAIHAQVNPAHTPEGAFEVTKRVAWALRNKGVGLLRKDGGENIVFWNGISFAAARVCFPDGHIYKILSDVPATNGPSWQDNDYVSPSLYVPAMDPNR